MCYCLVPICYYLAVTNKLGSSSEPFVSVTMASSAINSPEPEDSSFSVPIIARLTVHISGPGNKKKSTKKDIKIKEFTHTFSATKANYLEFLTTFLTKHYIGNKLQVTDRRRYTCKIQVPPSKCVVPFHVAMTNANYSPK